MSVHADPPPAVVREPNRVTYLTGSQLGKGGFAICHRAELCEDGKPSGKIVALKIVRSKMEPAKLAQKFVTELQLHSKLHHPNIVEFYRAFSFEQSTYVVLELCENGSLADVIRKRKYLTMPEIRRYIIQTCAAVKYLHHRNIVHRDLKTGNLFLDKAMNVKVGDFGLAAMLVSKNDIGARRTTMCGTPNYLAPEILEKGGRGHNEKVDLWAIGIIAYTLAVGKAPFHAAKREDIYKKLQNCDYEWPDISKNQNDISNDLRHLVGSLLVPEDDRPGPDQIVSHAFFKMAFIPDHLDSSCTSKKPNWNVRPPTAETIQRGYSESWMKLCRASGVGEYAQGRLFPLTNAKRVASVVRDVEKEIAAGRAPIVPIPKDTVYLPYPERTTLLQPRIKELSEIAEEHESSSGGPTLSETSANARKLKTQKSIAERTLRIERLKENVDPLQVVDRPKPVAEMTRKKSCRKGDGLPPAVAPPEVASTEPAEAAKPTRSRQASRQDIPEVRSVPRVQGSREMVAGAVASSRQCSLEQAADQPALTRQASRRGKVTRVDSVILPKSTERTVQENPIEKTRTASRRCRATSRVPSTETQTIKDGTVKRPQQTIVVISSDESTPPTSSSDPSLVPFTDPGSVLARAARLRDNIASVLEGRGRGFNRSSKSSKLPFVTKWVDYSRKLGVGYVLDDGSIGCIMTSTSRHPVTNVVVRNGFSYLLDSKKDPDTIGQIPLEYYECQNDGLKEIAVGAERKKSTGIVWAKFGRYMCQQLGQAERRAGNDPSRGQQSTFVRFYERLGTVGIWGFSDGCFQVNFPDHTKLVISDDGKFCNFTCLSVEAMSHLKENGDLPYKFIKQRDVLSGSVAGLLYGIKDADSALVKTTEANLFRKKLRYVVDVVDEWIEGGGLGCSEDGSRRPRWDGPQLEDGKKQDWVTVGRHGGDVTNR